MNTENSIQERTPGSLHPAGSTAMPELNLTPREELAVINQRLKTHCDDCKDERAKALLEIAADCVRSAIHRR